MSRRLTALPVKARRRARKPKGMLLAIIGGRSKYGHVLRSVTVPRRRVPVESARVGLSHKDERLGWADITIYGQEVRAKIKMFPRSYADEMTPRLEVMPLATSVRDREGHLEVLDGAVYRVYLVWDDPAVPRTRRIRRHHERRDPNPRKNLPKGFRKWNYPERWYGKRYIVERRKAFGLTTRKRGN